MNTELPEQTGQLVRFESNTDSHPIWAPSAYGNEDKREYILDWISPNAKVVVQKAGEYGLLRWTDKLVLAVLVLFWNRQGRHPEGWVNFTVTDVAREIWKKVGGSQHEQIKDSLWRLRGCLVQHFSSFYSTKVGGYVSRKRGLNIVTYLTIYEYKNQDGEEIEATQARLNLDLVHNLIGNHSRPVSLDLWRRLSERGGLFEAYINSVLYKNHRVSKDVFSLWKQLGLSIKGARYASKLAHKMKPELDKMCADPYNLLERYEFEKSKTVPRGQNLVLYRRKNAYIDRQPPPHREPDLFATPKVTQLTPTDLDRQVEQIQFELGDRGDDFNIRRIVERMPANLITLAITDAVGRKKDGMLNTSAVAYFVGRMKNEAKERAIDLGFDTRPVSP